MRKDNLIRLVFFGIVFMLFGCSEDLFDELKTNSKNSYTFKRVPLNELATNQKFNKAYKKVSQKSLSNEISHLSKTQIENEYGFIIVDEPANVMEYDSKTSYSLEIEMDSTQTDELKNLVIEVDSLNASKQFIITYKLDENSAYHLSENEPIVIEEIAFDPNLAVSSRLRADCIDVTTIYCKARYGSNDYCYGADTDKGCYSRTVTKCTSGGGSELSVYGSLGVLASPVDSNHGSGGGGTLQTFPDTPCGRMQKKSTENAFRQNFKNLNSNTYYTRDYENGYCEKRDANGNPTYQFVSALSGTKSLTLLPGTISYMHVHMNDVQVDNEDGSVTTMLSVKMLSPADIFPLFGSLQSNAVAAGLTPLDTYCIMLSNEGIFSVNLIDSDFVLTGVIKAQIGYEYNIGVADVFKNTLPNTLERKEGLQKMLLKILKKNGLGDKVSLYEGETEIDLGDPLPKINWIKKSLDASGNLVETPC